MAQLYGENDRIFRKIRKISEKWEHFSKPVNESGVGSGARQLFFPSIAIIEMKSSIPLAALSAVVFFLDSQSAGAATIISSYNGTTGGSATTLNTHGKAVSFTMGAGSYTLDSITFYLRTTTGTTTITSANFSAELWTSVGNTPGAYIGKLNLTSSGSVGTTTSAYEFSYSPTLTLNATATYWVSVKSLNNSTNVTWVTGTGTFPDSPSLDGVSRGGTVYGTYGTNPADWTDTSSNYNAMTVQGTLVPEPSMALLGGLGFVSMFRRRR